MSHLEEDEDEQLISQNKKFSCRFYEQKYPEMDDLVMVKVQSVSEMGVYVTLLEYDNIEGMILSSELSRRRIRSISKLVRVGKTEVALVLRVDKDKGYFDLSKSRVLPEDVQKCEERYNKSKTVHSIVRHLAEKHNESLEELNKAFCWPLYKKYGHALDAFKLAMTEPHILDDPELTFPNEKIKKDLLDLVHKRLKPQPEKIRADFEVQCFGYDGIDGVKAALKEGEKVGTEECPIKITLVAPPLYVIVTTSEDKLGGIQLLTKAIKAIESKILSIEGGSMNIKQPPRVVNAKDDHSLSVMLEQLTQQNKEIDGDDDNEEAME